MALSACFKMDVDLELSADDTVDGTIVMAFSSEFRDMAGMMGEDMDMMDEMLGGGFGELGEDMPDYASVEEYDDGEYVGQQVNFDGAPLSDFQEGGAEGLSITHEGEEFIVEGAMDMSNAEEEMGDLGDLPSGMAEGMSDFEIRVAITFPGEVIEHNGSLSGTTVTWEPQIGETNEIFARAQDTGGAGGFPAWLWIVIGVVVVAVIAGLLYMFSRGKGNGSASGDSVQGQPSPGATAPGASGTAQQASGQSSASETPGASPQSAPASTGESTPPSPASGSGGEDVPPPPDGGTQER